MLSGWTLSGGYAFHKKGNFIRDLLRICNPALQQAAQVNKCINVRTDKFDARHMFATMDLLREESQEDLRVLQVENNQAFVASAHNFIFIKFEQGAFQGYVKNIGFDIALPALYKDFLKA